MTDPVIRPRNGLLLLKLQTVEGTAVVPSATADVITYEVDSLDRSDPYKADPSNESTGSFVAGSPTVLGQQVTFSFRHRLKGAGAGVTYTSSVKPPAHAALSACGWLGVFTASVSVAALTAGTTGSATLGTGFATTAQIYRGMPLVLSGTHAAGRIAMVSDYSAAKVASLVDLFATALDATDSATLPANWTYAPTSPKDSSSRTTMNPAATIYYYEDGRLYQYMDCRGTVDLDGEVSKPGYAMFSFTGTFVSVTDAAIPSNAVFPTQTAPILVQGSGVQPAFQINGKGLAISKWSLKNGGQIENPEDPNTPIGFGSGQIADRDPQLEIDPLQSLVANRNILADIAAFTQYDAAVILGPTQSAGNRVAITMPLIQPTDSAPGLRGKIRSETIHYAVRTPGVDNASRDGDTVLCFF